MSQPQMYVLRNLVSGEWQETAHLTDYRVEWLSNMMVERATWDTTAPTHQIGGQVIASPGYIWLRFWLLEQEVVLEKYFDLQRQAIGYYLPICLPVQRRSNHRQALSLYLALWLTPDGRVTVLHEERFDEAAAMGELLLRAGDARAVDPRAAGASTTDGAGQLATIDPPMEAWATWAMIAIVAAVMVGLVGVAMQRGAFAAVTTKRELQTLRDSLLTEIAHIDDRHALGQMSDTDWLRRRANLKTQLMDVVRRMEIAGHANQPKVSSS